MKLFSVIMAGGGGTRFWPLSRETTPKQVLNITGKDVMINETLKRLEGIINSEDTYIVTNEKQKEVLTQAAQDYLAEENILVEPLARNTAPCILLAAMKIWKIYGDSIMFVFPADHYISDVISFRSILTKAAKIAESNDKLITIGIQPTYPSSGYGYINYIKSEHHTEEAYRVLKYVEKPDIDTAMSYLQKGDYLWNSGMFIWKVSVIIESFKKFLPIIHEKMLPYENSIGTEHEEEELIKAYKSIESISIDYGIMEKSKDVLVIPGEFGWNDVGSWDSLDSVYQGDDNGNIIRADSISIDTRNTIFYGNDNRLITAIGLEDMIVVSTEDALLICPKSRAQDVKYIVEDLKMRGRKDLI